MKNILLIALSALSFQSLPAQSAADTSRDSQGYKVVKGFFLKKQLVSDTAFAWFAQNQKSYTPAADVVRNFSAGKDAVNLVVFGGTWCDDTRQILPRFFAIADAAGFPESRMTLVGVDRSKKTLFNLTEAFGITHVPTFVVMKDGKEVGRVVEYGKTGSPEKEVGELIAGAVKK